MCIRDSYQCSECETRYLAEQWCPDCARPCQRLGPGGICRQLPGDDHRSGTSPRCLPAPVGMYSECTQNVLSTATNAHRYPTVAAGICAGQRPVPLILNDSHPCEGSSRCTTTSDAYRPLTCRHTVLGPVCVRSWSAQPFTRESLRAARTISTAAREDSSGSGHMWP